jgi:cell division protein FtsB
MFKDTTLTVVLLSMIFLMIVMLVFVASLKKDTRRLQEEIQARKAQRESMAQPS